MLVQNHLTLMRSDSSGSGGQISLPVLQAMLDNIAQHSINIENTAFVCIQHLLYTTYDLLESLISLGVKPENIHIMGKSYSTSSEVVKQIIKRGINYYSTIEHERLGRFMESFDQDIDRMWRSVTRGSLDKNVIKNIIILDDGGHCIARAPKSLAKDFKIIAIEQTSSGLNKISQMPLQFPVIEVASSAAKQLIESPMIAAAVVTKCEACLPITQEKLSCAVIGLGVIGQAVAKRLLALGHKVFVYDNDHNKCSILANSISCNSLNQAIANADYIFGCSGFDVTQNFDVKSITTAKCLISCSSHDKEFLTLLKYIEKNYSYEYKGRHAYCQLNGVLVKILNKGCPINFDQSGESVPANDIQLTRGLLFGALIQGLTLCIADNGLTPTRYMLDPSLQKFVIQAWQEFGSALARANPNLNQFRLLEDIQAMSGGNFIENPLLTKLFKSGPMEAA